MSTHDTNHWNHHLETGDSHVDLQHQELFQLVSSLDSAIRDQDLSKIEAIIVFLEHYVIDHFDAEEGIMAAANFDGYAHHKAEHDIFESMVHDLRHMFDTNPSRAHLIFSIRKFIDRLVIHIRTVDIRIADIVHSQNHDTAESS
jgi:hemerythrin